MVGEPAEPREPSRNQLHKNISLFKNLTAYLPLNFPFIKINFIDSGIRLLIKSPLSSTLAHYKSLSPIHTYENGESKRIEDLEKNGLV